MSVSSLSASAQDYLKAVWALQEWSDAPVTPSAVAARVNVKLSTASDAIKKLTAQGLLRHARYGAVTLTPLGREHALAMVRRHRLIESFLVWKLGYSWDQVHDEAEALEHAVSDFFVDRLAAALDHPSRDPHGDPIPHPDGSVVHPAAVQLPRLPVGATAVVERIADDDSALLQYFASVGLGIGTRVQVVPGAPYSGTLGVTLGQATIALGEQAAAAVWVTPGG